MNRLWIAALAMLAFVPAPGASAATIVDPVVPKGLSDSPMDPPTPLQDAPVPPRLVQNELRGQRDADARQCLTLPTNRQVHACAERYRTRAARARAAKSVKTSAAVAPQKAEVLTKMPEAAPAATTAMKPAADAAKAPPPSAPPKTADVIKIPPLKPMAPEPAKK